jgi:hypothetical protein
VRAHDERGRREHGARARAPREPLRELLVVVHRVLADALLHAVLVLLARPLGEQRRHQHDCLQADDDGPRGTREPPPPDREADAGRDERHHGREAERHVDDQGMEREIGHVIPSAAP